MTTDEAPAPGEGTAGQSKRPPFDTSVANQARIYDYLLGGKDNYEADRAAVDAVLKIAPEMGFTAQGEPGVPRPGRPLPRRARPGYGSSSTSAPASRRRATPTRSPRPSRRRPGWCTWTTTRSCSRTRARC